MAITQVSNSLVKQDLTISGGTVDNTVIGSGTPAAGTFTTVAGALASTVTGTTAAASDNSTKIATTAYVTTALANLVDSAPGTLNTLNDLKYNSFQNLYYLDLKHIIRFYLILLLKL